MTDNIRQMLIEAARRLCDPTPLEAWQDARSRVVQSSYYEAYFLRGTGHQRAVVEMEAAVKIFDETHPKPVTPRPPIRFEVDFSVLT